METQIKAFYNGTQEIKVVTIFGYATKGIPSLEINGAGKLSKNIKEKLIFLTRNRQLTIPHRRYVICVDQNDKVENDAETLKWLEFPLLLTYWYLAGLVPIKKLENCLTSGWIKPNGEVYHQLIDAEDYRQISKVLPAIERRRFLLIGKSEASISSEMLLEHIPRLEFKYDYQIKSKVPQLGIQSHA